MVTAHFMFLAAFPLPPLLPQDLSNSTLKMEKLHDSTQLFWSLTETNNPSSTFFFFLVQICRLAPRPAPSGLMFAFG